MEEILKKYPLLINHQNVSRETLIDFEILISLILKKNSQFNLISKNSEENIRERHIIDSAQAIDFIDFNCSKCSDLGTGGGMPGIVLAIMVKNLKRSLKINLHEKSFHKSTFLREVSKKLNLNTEIIQKDVLSNKNMVSGSIIARGFKPLPVVIELIYENFLNYKNLILFMGKNGKEILDDTFKKWDFEYIKKKSITSSDSFLLNIKNIKKKN